MPSPSIVIFGKELKDARRSRLMLALIAGLGAVAMLSVIVGASGYHAKLADFQLYLSELRQAGIAQEPALPFFALQLLRGAVEYLEIIGSIVAIVIGYSLAAKEMNRGTLRLALSRPISSRSIAIGKLLALAVIWLLVTSVIGLVLFVSLRIVGGARLSLLETEKLFITIALAWVYLFMWSALSFALASSTKRLSTALIIGMMLWLGVVLIIPQIGDTMDPDNQVPGGLFSSLGIVKKAQEKAILAHFSDFENARDVVEATSLSKQFERASFAYLGQKDQYNQRSLPYITADMWANIMWLLAGAGIASGLAIVQSRKRCLLRRE
jgi:ABC-2 type transport system permease protein